MTQELLKLDFYPLLRVGQTAQSQVKQYSLVLSEVTSHSSARSPLPQL